MGLKDVNVGNIVKGHVNEVLGNNTDLYLERIKVCLGCELYTVRKSAKFAGPWCNAKEGGCGCRLNAKLRVLNEQCPQGKWTGKDKEGNELPFDESKVPNPVTNG